MVRVFLLDDHEVVRRGLRDLLDAEEDMEVVGEAGTAAEAMARIPLSRPDVAVLDVRLPDGDGIEVCREARSALPGLASLMLTSFTDDESLFAAIMAGAAGYVLKEIRTNDLVDGVRRVAGGESLLDPGVVATVVERLRAGTSADPRLSGLSSQEWRILDLISEGMTNRQIAAEMFLAEKTIKNYVSALLTKLGLDRRTEAAVLAVKAKQHGAG